MEKVAPRLSYANVMSTIAVFAVLGGGSAYAASKIQSGDIAKNAVRAKQIKAAAVTGAKLADGAVSTKKLADGAVEGAKLADGSVAEPKLAGGAVTEAKLGAGAVTGGKLGSGAVTEGKIADGAVTNSKLAAGAVTGDKVAADTLTGANIDEASLDLVRTFEFGPRTFTGAENFTLEGLDRHTVENSLIQVFYNPSAEAESAWYPIPGVGSGALYEARYLLFEASTNPPRFTLSIRLMKPDGSGAYPSAVSLRRLKIILMPFA